MLMMSTIVVLFLILILSSSGDQSCITSKDGVYKNNVKCINNDTYCGSWDLNTREFHPLGCSYREVTIDQGRKCLQNRTVTCMGDSQLRDMCQGIAYFLYGIDENFDVYWKHGTNPAYLEPHRNYLILPTKDIREFSDTDWQIQIFVTPNKNSIRDHARNILNNNFTVFLKDAIEFEGSTSELKPHDFVFFNYGVHEKDQFNSTPYGERYWNYFVQDWLDLREEVKTPSVWVSMNNECESLLNRAKAGEIQATSVEEANWLVHKRMREMGLPFFDSSNIMRSPERCSVSEDGLHVKQWTDIQRGKILLNYLCDDDWNWVGDVKAFAVPDTIE